MFDSSWLAWETDTHGGRIKQGKRKPQTDEEKRLIAAWLADPANYRRMLERKAARREEAEYGLA